MNILFLSQIVPFPPHGGVLQRGYNIIREISKENDVYLLAFVHPDTQSSPKILKEAKTGMQRYCKQVEFFPLWPKKSRLHTLLAFLLSIFYFKPFSTLAHRSAAFADRINKVITESKVDVVHFDTIGLAPYLKFTRNLPTVMTHHNIESILMFRRASAETFLPFRWYVKVQAGRLRKYEKEQSPKFDFNVVMSETDQAELKRLAPNAISVVVPNGVDVEYFSRRNDKQEAAVIYTGGMNMFANKDAVIHFIDDIWPQVKARVEEAVFFIIGQSPPEDLLRRAESDKSLQVMGFVEDIRPFVARSSVYIVPLRVGGGTRLKVLDSLAQGKAIVSTSIGCEGIDVVNKINIEIEDDDAGFANRVVELLGDDARREELGCEARRLAENKYSWASVSKNLLETYERLNSSGSRSES